MNFTLQQLRDFANISVETYRHWRRILPAFANRKGRSARFSTGDLLAAAILRHLTNECGIKISRLRVAANQIVTLCNEKSWVLERGMLVVNPAAGTCRAVGEGDDGAIEGVVILCPIKMLLADLRSTLMRSEQPQRPLAFPPIEIKRKRRA